MSLLGDGLAVLAIPLLVLNLSRNPLTSALSAASVTAGYLAVGLPAGVLIDRLDAWRVLVTMDVVRALLFGMLYMVAVTGALTVWLILLIALAAGASSVFFETALVIVVKDLFSGPGLLRANSWLEFANQGALMAGPAIVGVLAASGNIRAALLANSLTFVASLVSLTAVRGAGPSSPHRSCHGRHGSRHARHGSCRGRHGSCRGRHGSCHARRGHQAKLRQVAGSGW